MPETVLFEWSKRDKRHGHHKSDGSPVEYSDTGRGTCRSDTVLCSARVIQLWSKKKTPDGYTTKVLMAIIGKGQFNIRCLDAGAGNVAWGVAVSCTVGWSFLFVTLPGMVICVGSAVCHFRPGLSRCSIFMSVVGVERHWLTHRPHHRSLSPRCSSYAPVLGPLIPS